MRVVQKLYAILEMIEEPFDTIDKSFLRSELIQGLLGQTLILVVGGILFWIGYIFLNRSNPFELETSLVRATYITLTFLIFSFVIWTNLKSRILDINSGYKIVSPGLIEAKSDQTKYGWTGNPAVDFRTQPKLVEFQVVVNGVNYFIEQAEYEKLEVGEKVNLHLLKSTKKLTRIEKSIPHGV